MSVDAELARVAADALEEARVPGCGIAIAHGDETWSCCLGLANVASGQAFTAQTRMPIGSVTKPYTATAAMALVQAGRLDLDAPVRRYLPEFRLGDVDASEQVTVRHLLTHRGGWPGDRDDMADPLAPRGDGALAAAVRSMADLEQLRAPGTAWSYSNAGFMVAGRVIEVLTGLTYEDAVARLVLEPLGLSESGFFADRAATAPLAVGHAAREDGDGFDVKPPWACIRSVHPAGGVISTVGDQLRWLRWWLSDDVEGPLGLETRRRMLEERTPAGSMCDEMGIGWLIDHVAGAEVIHHYGSLWNMQSMTLFVPAAGLALAVLANARGGVLLQRRLRDYALERWAGLRPVRHEPIELDDATLQTYLGRYRLPSATSETVVEVRRNGHGLTMGPLDEGGALAEPIDVRFFAPDETVIASGPLEGLRAEFLRDADGTLGGLRFGGRIAVPIDRPTPET